MENETNGILLLTLCMKNETVLISHEVLETLENPKHIQVLVNYEKKKLLLQSCEMTDKHAIVVPDDTMDSFLMSGPVLLKSLYRAMEWVRLLFSTGRAILCTLWYFCFLILRRYSCIPGLCASGKQGCLP